MEYLAKLEAYTSRKDFAFIILRETGRAYLKDNNLSTKGAPKQTSNYSQLITQGIAKLIKAKKSHRKI